MSEVTIELDGEDKPLRPDNCEINRFRPPHKDKDYFEYWEEHGEEKKYFWVFGLTEFVLWASGVVLDNDDAKMLRTAERSNGSFEQVAGWRPIVHVWNTPTEPEQEMYVKSLTRDLEALEFVPEDFYE